MGLESLKVKLKEGLVDGTIKSTLNYFISIVKKNCELYNDLILVQANYATLERDIALNLISYEHKNLSLSKIRGGIIFLIDRLNVNFLDTLVKKQDVITEGADLALEAVLNPLDFSVDELYLNFKRENSNYINELERIHFDAVDVVNKSIPIDRVIQRLRKSPQNKDLLIKKYQRKIAEIFNNYSQGVNDSSRKLLSQHEKMSNSLLLYLQARFAISNMISKEEVNEIIEVIQISISKYANHRNRLRELISNDENSGSNKNVNKDLVRALGQLNFSYNQMANTFSGFIAKMLNLDDAINSILFDKKSST